MTTGTDQPTLADIADMFRQFSEELHEFRDENKTDRRDMEGRISRRLDDVLDRLAEYQRRTDDRLTQFYGELDTFRTETTMRLQDVEARLKALEERGQS